MTAVGDLKSTAVEIGFDPDAFYSGYSVEALCYFILEDKKFEADFDANWQREISECPVHSHPDDILRATLASYSETEKAALRRRVLAALERWDGE